MFWLKALDLWSVLATIMLIIIITLFLNIFGRNGAEVIKSLLRKTNHKWKTKSLELSRCFACKVLLVTTEGFYCETCGICSDTKCLKKVNRVKCKEWFTDSQGPLKHRFINGILPGPLVCNKCDEDASDCLNCIWCHRDSHELSHEPTDCDGGKYNNFLIPPNCVLRERKWVRIGKLVTEFKILEPSWSNGNWTPLFIIGNKLSGNRSGERVLSSFIQYLNPIQVLDLSENDPNELCRWLALLPETAHPYILAAGGDGTISWILTTLNNSPLLKEPPAVGIIPLGTGNDLGRVLGWGAEEDKPFDPKKYFRGLKYTTVNELDRWSAKWIPLSGRLRRRSKEQHFYNYMSIGVDALIALNFHEARKATINSIGLGGRIYNKLLYLIFGTHQVMERECHGLQNFLELYMDGQPMAMPELESLILLNISSWSAGVNLWEVGSPDNIQKQSINDSKIEVASVSSSFQIAQLQMGMNPPNRFGQASQVTILLKKRLPVQIDGEPWMQNPCKLEVRYSGKAKVLIGQF